MNKSGHLRMTKGISSVIDSKYKPFLLLGSILPDILIYTYLTGHTINESFGNIKKKMQKLERWGKLNWYSYIGLGYVLHYVEDYFTYPHNESFTGSLAEHCRYESGLSEYLFQGTFIDDKEQRIARFSSAEELYGYINDLHERYMKESPGFETDKKYIMEISKEVLECFNLAFRRNQSFVGDFNTKEPGYVFQRVFVPHRQGESI